MSGSILDYLSKGVLENILNYYQGAFQQVIGMPILIAHKIMKEQTKRKIMFEIFPSSTT
jgi:hypothetical protein